MKLPPGTPQVIQPAAVRKQYLIKPDAVADPEGEKEIIAGGDNPGKNGKNPQPQHPGQPDYNFIEDNAHNLRSNIAISAG
jgi:hypothetical protein